MTSQEHSEVEDYTVNNSSVLSSPCNEGLWASNGNASYQIKQIPIMETAIHWATRA